MSQPTMTAIEPSTAATRRTGPHGGRKLPDRPADQGEGTEGEGAHQRAEHPEHQPPRLVVAHLCHHAPDPAAQRHRPERPRPDPSRTAASGTPPAPSSPSGGSRWPAAAPGARRSAVRLLGQQARQVLGDCCATCMGVATGSATTPMTTVPVRVSAGAESCSVIRFRRSTARSSSRCRVRGRPSSRRRPHRAALR